MVPSPLYHSRNASPHPPSSRFTVAGFTLIEMLVVIAVISILAAILFPVFSQVREKSRAIACLSNMKQIGLATQLYIQDNDEYVFPYVALKVSTGLIRVRSRLVPASAPAAIPITTPDRYSMLWYNTLTPYLGSIAVLNCPDSSNPVLLPDAHATKDASGNYTVRLSYIACRAAEGLSLSQLADPVETMVVTEKWDTDAFGVPVPDAWISVHTGNLVYDAVSGRMAVAGNRHQGGINAAFFDGHAKWYRPQTIDASADLTGCNLIHTYPFADMTTTQTAGAVPNPCVSFSY